MFYGIFSTNKSPLPLTDPRDAVPHAHRVVHKCRRSVWQTGDRRPSPVYHTDRPPELTAPETISRYRDMVGSHQNGLRDLTTSLSGMVCHPWASTCYRQPTYQIEVFISTHYKDITGDTKCQNGMVWVVRLTQGHWK